MRHTLKRATRIIAFLAHLAKLLSSRFEILEEIGHDEVSVQKIQNFFKGFQSTGHFTLVKALNVVSARDGVQGVPDVKWLEYLLGAGFEFCEDILESAVEARVIEGVKYVGVIAHFFKNVKIVNWG